MATSEKQELEELNAKIDLIEAELEAIDEERRLMGLSLAGWPCKNRFLRLREDFLKKTLKPLLEQRANRNQYLAWDARTRA